MAGFPFYLSNAKVVFSTGISNWVLQAGYELDVKLPDRVGGHDVNRNTTGGNQQGSGGSADDHGKNQGNQWSSYKSDVEAAWKKKYKVVFDESHVNSQFGKGANSKEEKDEKDDYEPPKNIPKQDPTKSATEKEKAAVIKLEAKKTKQELSEELTKLLKDTTRKNNFLNNPKSGPIAELVEELAKEAKISGTDNKAKLKAIGEKFSNVKKVL